MRNVERSASNRAADIELKSIEQTFLSHFIKNFDQTGGLFIGCIGVQIVVVTPAIGTEVLLGELKVGAGAVSFGEPLACEGGEVFLP